MGSFPSSTAIHEAGHCVQAMLDSIGCIVSRTRSGGGWMRPTEEMNPETDIRMSVAGAVAEFISCDAPSMDGLISGGDMQAIVRRFGEIDEAQLGHLVKEVGENLNAHWPKVMRIASAIDYHDYLDERELWALFNHEKPRPLKFTENGRKKVVFMVSRGE